MQVSEYTVVAVFFTRVAQGQSPPPSSLTFLSLHSLNMRCVCRRYAVLTLYVNIGGNLSTDSRLGTSLERFLRSRGTCCETDSDASGTERQSAECGVCVGRTRTRSLQTTCSLHSCHAYAQIPATVVVDYPFMGWRLSAGRYVFPSLSARTRPDGSRESVMIKA